MESAKPSTEPNIKSKRRPARRGLLYQLEITLGVAFLIATLFTAWTPADLLVGNLRERLAEGILPLETPAPGAEPTAAPQLTPRIGIVVGHWDDNTKDPGAVCADGALTEFQVNQSVATRVQADLEKLGYEVDLLREFDPLLNDYEAMALVSIHADSCDYINDAATGYKVAASMANPRPERSQRLVACLRTRYGQSTGMKLHSTSVTDDMTSYHAFEEINPETTSAIIEVGFLNLDRQILTQHQDFIAKGITDGILCFVNNEDISP
jgi:N-acetylmuramoyl-L-alanine amidase